MKMTTTVLVLAGVLSSAAAQAEDILKIGAIVPLSGAGAAWGQALLYGAQLAAEDLNSSGGLEVAGKKYRLQVIPYDDKYQANEAVTAATRLVSD